MKKLFQPAFRPGFAPILIIGLVAIVVFMAFVVFGPFDLPNLGQLSLRQQAQKSFAQTPIAPPLGDSDQDGFTDEVEKWIKTDANDNCPDNAQDAAWPPDFNNDKLVNQADVDMLMKYFGQRVRGENNRRFDLDGDKTIGLADSNLLRSYFSRGCPFQFLAANPSIQRVAFSWTPTTAQSLVLAVTMVDSTSSACESAAWSTPAAPQYLTTLAIGSNAYTWVDSANSNLTARLQPGKTYCVAMKNLGTDYFQYLYSNPVRLTVGSYALSGYSRDVGGVVLYWSPVAEDYVLAAITDLTKMGQLACNDPRTYGSIATGKKRLDVGTSSTSFATEAGHEYCAALLSTVLNDGVPVYLVSNFQKFTMPGGVTISCNIYASPNDVALGSSTTLYWQSQGATSASISPEINSTPIIPLFGSATITPRATTTYTMTVYSSTQNNARCSTTVYVGGGATSTPTPTP